MTHTIQYQKNIYIYMQGIQSPELFHTFKYQCPMDILQLIIQYHINYIQHTPKHTIHTVHFTPIENTHQNLNISYRTHLLISGWWEWIWSGFGSCFNIGNNSMGNDRGVSWRPRISTFHTTTAALPLRLFKISVIKETSEALNTHTCKHKYTQMAHKCPHKGPRLMARIVAFPWWGQDNLLLFTSCQKKMFGKKQWFHTHYRDYSSQWWRDQINQIAFVVKVFFF